MEFLETKFPTNEQIAQMKVLYDSLNNVSIVQHPLWPGLSHFNSTRFFLIYDSGKVLAYTRIIESSLSRLKFIKTAEIRFGPISRSVDSTQTLLQFIIDWYSKNNYSKILIQFPFNFKSADVINEISSRVKLVGQKATILIDLSNGIESIALNYTTNLKRNLKKAAVLKLEVREIISDDEVQSFWKVYQKMSGVREINFYTNSDLNTIFDFLKSNSLGSLIGCFNEQKQIVGGLLLIRQGNKSEYFLGATDPDYRDIPQAHLTHHFAMKYLIEQGVKYYDFGGYRIDPDETSQLFNINRFKLQFSKNIVHYPSKIEISLNAPFNAIEDVYLKLAGLSKKAAA
jgi:hypothetical protein